MSLIRYHALIPAENPARAGRSLNVLLVMENPTDRDVFQTVRLFGSLGGPWRELVAEDRAFPAHSHPHLYFTIPDAQLSPDFWGGEGVEELELFAGERPPEDTGRGVLVFFE